MKLTKDERRVLVSARDVMSQGVETGAVRGAAAGCAMVDSVTEIDMWLSDDDQSTPPATTLTREDLERISFLTAASTAMSINLLLRRDEDAEEIGSDTRRQFDHWFPTDPK